MTEFKSEATHATKSALYLVVGYVASTVLSAVLAILVPAILGAGHYGDWVIFRSLISLTITMSMVGTSQVISRYYVGLMAKGEEEEAARLYKTMFVLRSGTALLFAAIGCLLLVSLNHQLMGLRAGLWLAVSIFFHASAGTLSMLLHSQKRMGLIALLMIPNAFCVPAAVALGYIFAGFDVVPMSCAIGDVVLFLIAMTTTLRYMTWPRGWMARSYWREAFRYGGFSAIGGSIITLFSMLSPYLMGFFGAPSEEVGFVGLGLRFQNLIWWGLMNVCAGMFPFMTVAFEREGINRVVVWHSLLGRLGSVGAMYAMGIFFLVGHALIDLVWGPSYDRAVTVIMLFFVGTLPLWIGSQYTGVAMVAKRAELFTSAVIAMNVVMFGVFFILLPYFDGLGVAIANVCGMITYMFVAMALTRRSFGVALQIKALWWPFAITLVAYPLGKLSVSPLSMCIYVAAWTLVFLLVSIVSGSFHFYELREILARLVESKKVAPPPVDAA